MKNTDTFAKHFEAQRKAEIMKDKKADFDKKNQYKRQQKAYKFLVRAWNSMAKEVLHRFKMDLVTDPYSAGGVDQSWLTLPDTACMNIDVYVKHVIQDLGEVGIRPLIDTYLSDVRKYEEQHPEIINFISRYFDEDKSIQDFTDLISKEFVNLLAKDAKEKDSAFDFSALTNNTQWVGGYNNSIEMMLEKKTDKDIIAVYDSTMGQNLLFYSWNPAMKRLDKEVDSQLHQK